MTRRKGVNVVVAKTKGDLVVSRVDPVTVGHMLEAGVAPSMEDAVAGEARVVSAKKATKAAHQVVLDGELRKQGRLP